MLTVVMKTNVAVELVRHLSLRREKDWPLELCDTNMDQQV